MIFNTAFFQPCREPGSSGKRYHWGWRCYHWCISVLSGKKSCHRFSAGNLLAGTGAGMADLCRLLCKLQHYKKRCNCILSGLYHIREMDAGKEKESSLNLTFLKKIPWLKDFKNDSRCSSGNGARRTAAFRICCFCRVIAFPDHSGHPTGNEQQCPAKRHCLLYHDTALPAHLLSFGGINLGHSAYSFPYFY